MKQTRVDKRHNINTYEHWVYGLYLNEKLIYVGVTADPSARMESHSLSKHFDEMRLIRGFSNRERAEQYENVCILTFQNILNIVKKNPRKVGFHQNVPKISKFEYDAWTSLNPKPFDFALLSNAGISRRKHWQTLDN